MGQEMKLDVNVKSSEGLSPDTVLSSHQYPLNVKRRYKKVKHIGKDEFWTVTEDLSKIRFARFRSSSCKSILSRPNGQEVNVEMRRASMHQSSEEVNSDDEGPRKKSSLMRKDSKMKSRNDRVTVSQEKDAVHSLVKSFSAKVEVSHLLSPSKNECSSKANSNVQSTSIKKMLNSFMKSKSLTKKYSDIISEFISRDIQHSGSASSPVHLHGSLKFENRHGVPFFEFKVKCPEDLLVAKTWSVDNAFNWVYTFHSVDARKKSSATGLESHDCGRGSSMVAKMLVFL
ncbi:uncharacterized protein LOC129322027 [Prosopis cineraria]|uniref:uncharacterized protein LOC129322027 n=1 Tax=Prosopis cineraria TaxID=364024 RepID=UPI00240ECF16|nr:uncharacterized protein LOC129322027 [Prosopis cineraria]